MAPGELVAIAINRLSISTAAATSANTTVMVDSYPAQLISVTSTQITAMVPFEIAGEASTILKISIAGQAAAPITLNTALTAPGIFITGNGPTNGRNDQAAVINQDGTVNSQSNPAVRGSTVTIYGTGAGELFPVATDGSAASSTPATPIAAVSATIDGLAASVGYAGGSPGLSVAVLQVNAVVPATSDTGKVKVAITVGGVSSQSGANMWVK